MPEPKATVQRWRDYCSQAGIGDPFLVMVQAFEATDPIPFGFDAAVEFPPHKLSDGATSLNNNVVFVSPDFKGNVCDYGHLIKSSTEMQRPEFSFFRGVCTSWDNHPRRPGNGLTYVNSTPQAYENWLTVMCRYANEDPDPARRIVFINAWNEWSEGDHLEPDKRYGYAYLQATRNALKRSGAVSAGETDLEIFFVSHDAARAGAQRLLLTMLGWLREQRGV